MVKDTSPEDHIFQIIRSSPGLKASEIARELGLKKTRVNSLLYGLLNDKVRQDAQYRWWPRDEEHSRQQERDRHRVTQDDPPDMDKKYGRILGLTGKVKCEDVKHRWRKLSKQYHPDNVNHLGPKLKELAEKEMKDINEAYQYFKRKYGI